MAEVKIIYWSGTGNTAAMAQSVADGVAAAGAQETQRLWQIT